MSGMEVVAVVACVAGVVSAFEHGEALVKKIREKRQLKRQGALPPQKLERSLALGPPAINQAKEDGIMHFGKKFEEGDSIAQAALIQIKDKMYESIIGHLYAAVARDDSIDDFNVLVDVSNLGRIRSVMVLNELLMRMAQQAPIQAIQNWPDSNGDQGRKNRSSELGHIVKSDGEDSVASSGKEHDINGTSTSSPTRRRSSARQST